MSDNKIGLSEEVIDELQSAAEQERERKERKQREERRAGTKYGERIEGEINDE